MMDRKALIAKIVAKRHSPAKALEIAIDVERGNAHAIAWLNALGVARWRGKGDGRDEAQVAP